MNEIQKFIKDNKLSFKQGSRNTTCTVLTGYAQYLGLSENKLKAEVVDEIDADKFIGEEISRVWKYAESKGYKNYWETLDAKKQWKF